MIADDHPIVRAGLRLLIDSEPDLTIVGEGATADEAISLARERQPDVVLMDVAMPGRSGLDALTAIAACSKAKVLLLTAAIEKADVLLGLQRGARGVVLKDAATQMLVKSIHAVMRGEYWIEQQIVGELVERAAGRSSPASAPAAALTPREREIAAAVAKGRSNRDIADLLELSEETVKHHLTNIFNKTGLSNRVELALFALDHHIDRAS